MAEQFSLKCDRCGATAQVRDGAGREHNWEECAHYPYRRSDTTALWRFHLCVDCRGSFSAWFNGA